MTLTANEVIALYRPDRDAELRALKAENDRLRFQRDHQNTLDSASRRWLKRLIQAGIVTKGIYQRDRKRLAFDRFD